MIPASGPPVNAAFAVRRVRGRQVLLDRDAARLYGVPLAALRRALREEAGRFPPDLAFRVSAAEARRLRWRGRPVALTAVGVAMLSTVLPGELAARFNVEIVRAVVDAGAAGFETLEGA
ncbi:MAG: ORF6N domain-containing protein [Planctomycetes bacterium]|nr:ORF6N domain-containing protein [Planctomycetota bacterium]